MAPKKTIKGFQTTLFPAKEKVLDLPVSSPLAARMRPQNLDDFVGQRHLLGPGKILHRLISTKTTQSLIFWGPPGSGKTTLAHILAREWGIAIIDLSAVLVGLKEVRQAISSAKQKLAKKLGPTILFIDEIHRFNKAQQDALLPHVEEGTIVLIGATTENPSFAIISPLLSRLRVLRLDPLSPEEIEAILKRALKDEEKGFGNMPIDFGSDAFDMLIAISEEDARVALNLLEICVLSTRKDDTGNISITTETVEQVCEKKPLFYDKSGEEHYNLISALHKSLRGSDPDAGLYYLSRMLMAGEDPLYIARRLVRFASEDIGLADPRALGIAVASVQAYQMLGQPEGELALAEAVVYLATAPKSNALYTAYGYTREIVRNSGALPVPLRLRNAPTRFMKQIGYGKKYKYPHDYKDAFVKEEYLPKKISREKFYYPTNRGEEKVIRERLKNWRQEE